MKRIVMQTVAVTLILITLGCSKNYIDVVKDGELVGYPGKKIGPILEKYMGPCEWEYIQTPDSNKFVNISGKRKSSTIMLQIKIIDDANLEVSAYETDGIDWPPFEAKPLLEELFNYDKSEVIKYKAENIARTVASLAATYYSQNFNEETIDLIKNTRCDFGGKITFGENSTELSDDYNCVINGNDVIVTHKSGQTQKSEWR